MSAGREILVRTARGAMLYDGSCTSQPDEQVFDPAYWRTLGVLEQHPGGRGTIAFVNDGTRRWVLRHYRRGGLVARLLDDTYLWTGATRTRSLREWRLLDRLHSSGLPVPRPVAARYVRTGVVYRADLITEELPTRRTIAQALADGPLDTVTWQVIGATVGRLHAHGVQHADLNAHNLLLGDDGAVYVLDFDRGRIRPRGAWEQDVLARLRRSLVKVTTGLPPDRFDVAAWAGLVKGSRGE